MARFYGRMVGNRGEVTRTGDSKSGLVAHVAGWTGAVRSKIYDHDGEDWVIVQLVPWQGVGVDALLYDGPVNPKGRITSATEHGRKDLNNA